MSFLRPFAIIVVSAASAAADPGPPPPVTSVTTSNVTTPANLTLTPLTLFEVPQPIVPSLRIEAARVAAERYQDNWRFPEPGALAGFDGSGFFIGAGYYRPRTARSAALHAGAAASSLLGEILLATDSPLAGLGALATGATLDAAAADADRDAEARKK
jgi:hypothetical protein